MGGISTLVAAVAFGPSIGRAYAGAPLRAWGGGALRFLAIAIGAYGYIEARPHSTHEGPGGGEDIGGESVGAFVLSAALLSAICDISTAPAAARRANERNCLSSGL